MAFLRFIFILFIFFALASNAQNFEWAHNAGYPGSLCPNFSYSVSTDKEGNSYYIGTFCDSVYFNKMLLKGLGSSTFIAKYAPFGNLIWVKTIHSKGGVNGFGIIIDSIGNIFVTGQYAKDIHFSNNDSFAGFYNYTFLAKYDTSGSFKWAVRVGKVESSKSLVLDKNGYIYIGGNDSSGIYIAKFSNVGKLIWWWKNNNSKAIRDMSIDENANLYATGNNENNNDDIIIIKLDSSGRLLWIKNAGGKGRDIGSGIKSFENGSFYLVGQITDTANFEGETIGTMSTGSHSSAFAAFYSGNGKLKWIKYAGSTGDAEAAAIGLHKQYAYIGGYFHNCNPSFGRTTLFNSGGVDLFISKMDSNGNFLWSFGTGRKNTSSQCWNIATDTSGNSFTTGWVSGDVDYGKFLITGYGTADAFFLKISDVSLWRNNLSKTQYCTGDSINVPYRISGVIGPGNTFTAELSDSNGSFDSVWHVIGKIKSQNSGIIKCRLPSNLPYSSRYNVHVYSDTPNVTSYYNPQTITIYPYPDIKVKYDTSACYGTNDTLRASGGVGYLWLPATGLSNNKIAGPIFKADTTRTYTLIAYNALGCADTAKLLIKVGPRLYVKTAKDTTICPGRKITINATASGGQDTAYTYTWDSSGVTVHTGRAYAIRPYRNVVYSVSATDGCAIVSKNIRINIFSPLKVNAGKDQGICPGHANLIHATGTGGDTAAYKFTWFDNNGAVLSTRATTSVAPTTTTIYRVRLSDNGCSLKADSAHVTVYRTLPLKLFMPRDTAICYGQKTNLTAYAKGGDSLRYIFSWDTGGVSFYTGATARVVPTGSGVHKFRCIVADSCSLHSDTGFVNVTVSPALKLKLSPFDTTICRGNTVTLLGTPHGGSPANYTIQWDTGGVVISNRATTRVTPMGSSVFRAILSDGCSLADTAFDTVFVRPGLKIIVKDSAICLGDSVLLQGLFSGGDPLHHHIMWDTGGVVFSNRATTRVAPTRTTVYHVNLTDSCTITPATAAIKVTVNPQPRSILEINPTELMLGEGAISFKAKNTDADSFLWYFGDGQNAQGQQQSHTYSDTGAYQPKLISINNLGCRDTASGELIILPTLHIYFPNVFTPDADKLNDEWLPKGIGIARIHIIIYSRWGGHIFQSESLEHGWKGDLQGEGGMATHGRYPYIVNAWDYAGRKHTFTGTVLLLNTGKY
jgi:gliding motility-associated-like protein